MVALRIQLQEIMVMPTLHVRNVADEVHDGLQKLAPRNHWSLSVQVVQFLQRGLEAEQDRERQAKLLTAIRHRRFVPRAGALDSLTLLGSQAGQGPPAQAGHDAGAAHREDEVALNRWLL